MLLFGTLSIRTFYVLYALNDGRRVELATTEGLRVISKDSK